VLGGWTRRRGREARAEALVDLADELRATVAVALGNARRHGEQAVADALRGSRATGAAVLAGAAAIDAADPGPTPVESAAAWLRAAEQAVRGLRDADDRPGARAVARLLRGTGPVGAGTLAALAAAGLGAADAALTGALGAGPSREVVGRLRDDLAERAAEQARSAARPARAFLAGPDLADDAAAALRLRVAVLKGLR